MSDYDDFEAESGPWIVLKNGSTFDEAEDCEIAYLTKRGDGQLFKMNRYFLEGNSIGHMFEKVDIDEIKHISLRKIIKFYFENNEEEKDPMS
tara:strand:- start:136 stop:411 length:276 start_codon:yes stop_codon:yes gene_type:complete